MLLTAPAMLLSNFYLPQILDWYKKTTGKNYQGDDDPGVQSVKRIFNYYKQHGYKTIVMGASFRNVRISPDRTRRFELNEILK